MKKGKFIVLDGPDGSGKGTEINLLKAEFAGANLIFTQEPGAAHVEQIVRPALNSGTHVISDRFDSSTFAYQIVADARPEFLGLFKEAREVVLRDCFPDAYIFLNLSVSIIQMRIEGDKMKRTRYDIKPTEYHEKVIEGFKKFASDFTPSFIIDAARPPTEGHDEILPIVRKILGI